MKKITPLLSWTFKSFLSLMIILFISNRTIAQTGTVATDKADYFPAKKNAFWIALLAFFMLALQPFSVGAQTFCALDPIPSTQLNLRLNAKYERGKCPAGDVIVKGASIDVGGPCNSCKPVTTITGRLYITVDHTTNSQNRFLGVFAILTETSPDGTTLRNCVLARASGPLKTSSQQGLSGQQVVNYGDITFTRQDIYILFTNQFSVFSIYKI